MMRRPGPEAFWVRQTRPGFKDSPHAFFSCSFTAVGPVLNSGHHKLPVIYQQALFTPPPPCACTALSKHRLGIEPPF